MNELVVVSYNVWFSETLEIERTNSLIETIFCNDADVICMQELKPHIYEILITQLKKYKYHYPKRIEQNYGCAIISRYPISKTLTYDFNNSLMGRSLQVVQIDYPFHNYTEEGVVVENCEIIVANTHFESVFNKQFENTTKLQQYDIAESQLNSLYEDYGNIIFCADLNILDHEEEKFFRNSIDKWKDSWELRGNDSNKYTFDSKTNIYLQIKKYKYRSRLDRILFRTDECVLDEFRRLEGVQGSTQPSDHYGVLCKFSVKRKSEVDSWQIV